MKTIIIGATSGIGEALAKVYADKGYTLGLTGRRIEKLEVLQKALPVPVYIQQMDVTQFETAQQQLLELIKKMGDDVDIIIVNAGVGEVTSTWEKERRIIDTNTTGFAAMMNTAYHYFKTSGRKGSIAGISSVASVRGGGLSTAYHATKAFASSYMQGLRYKIQRKKMPVSVTDIRPGFVKTPMTEANETMFWVASADKAALQIYQAIAHKQKVAYITRRWRLVAWIMRLIPDFLFGRVA